MTLQTSNHRPFDPVADGTTRIMVGVISMLIGLIPFVHSVPSQWASGIFFGLGLAWFVCGVRKMIAYR
jgi:hypothetical protein